VGVKKKKKKKLKKKKKKIKKKENGKNNLFGFGRNIEGQLGIGIFDDFYDMPVSKLFKINFFNDKNISDLLVALKVVLF
jgi:alpha-tubulin suppressor-like RCC1 family protein